MTVFRLASWFSQPPVTPTVAADTPRQKNINERDDE